MYNGGFSDVWLGESALLGQSLSPYPVVIRCTERPGPFQNSTLGLWVTLHPALSVCEKREVVVIRRSRTARMIITIAVRRQARLFQQPANLDIWHRGSASINTTGVTSYDLRIWSQFNIRQGVILWLLNSMHKTSNHKKRFLSNDLRHDLQCSNRNQSSPVIDDALHYVTQVCDIVITVDLFKTG